MQLNHNTLHEIVIITEIDTRQNLIFYERYENQNGILLETSSFEPKDDDLKNHLNEQINYTELCYTILKNEFFTDFTVSEDVQNWKVTTRPIRLIFPVKLINSSLIEQNELNTLIQRELEQNANATEKYLFNEQNVAICYFNAVADADAGIITPYLQTGEIIMQPKQ